MSSSSSNTQNIVFMSYANNNSSNSNQAVNTAHKVFAASTQANIANSTNIDSLSDVVIFAFFASQPNSSQHVNEDLEQIHPDSKVECYNCHKKGYFTRECRAPRNQDNRNKEITRKSMPVETNTSNALISCDGLGGYDWSGQAKEGHNYALMAYSSSSSDSKVSNDSICSKTYKKTIKTLKTQNEKLDKDLRQSKLMVLGYKEGLKSVEARLEYFKSNKSIYVQDIKKLKWDVEIRDLAITDLTEKLELA
ncbi:ribonuclease H-like domain-containing protein [Tanacetum coccineum]